MDAILGVGLFAAMALLFAWSYGQFRSPQRRAWTRSDFAANVIAITISGLFAFGVLFVTNFLTAIATETHWLKIAAVVSGALLVLWFFIPRLMAPALQGAGTPSSWGSPSTDTPPEPANDPSPSAPVRPDPSAGKPGGHRAA